jgi:DeoR family fructose operon transcriptional repressor
MLTEERRAFILHEVNDKGSATVQELVAELSASESTVRRDINALARDGMLVRVFGGAVAMDGAVQQTELSVIVKESINVEEKRKIGKHAAELVVPGDYVYIDSGTTVGCMIPFLHEKQATYVTNAVSHAKDMVRKGLHVLLIGGELKENTEAIVGADAILHIQKYHFTKAFFGTNGISLTSGFTTPDIREAMIKRAAVQNTRAGARYILADHSKFGQTSPVTFAGLQGSVVITDVSPGEIYLRSVDVQVVGSKE